MKILFAVSEAFPFAKSGGLADVAYSLPKALRNLGVDIRVIMPKYSDIHPDFYNKDETYMSFHCTCWMAKSILWNRIPKFRWCTILFC